MKYNFLINDPKRIICNNKKTLYPFVFRLIVDSDGHILGVITKKFNGTKEDAIRIAKDITSEVFKVHPNSSNIQSIMGAINKKGVLQFNISPNFKYIHESEIVKTKSFR